MVWRALLISRAFFRKRMLQLFSSSGHTNMILLVTPNPCQIRNSLSLNLDMVSKLWCGLPSSSKYGPGARGEGRQAAQCRAQRKNPHLGA
eukprot:1095535-Alexandrium_andersonii.AAC.1